MRKGGAELIFATPNAGKRTPRQGAYMKAEGLRPGVPDLMLPVARGGFHGLFIELKAEKGRMNPNQEEWLHNLSEQGYMAVMCRGWDAARKTIESYLELPSGST